MKINFFAVVKSTSSKLECEEGVQLCTSVVFKTYYLQSDRGEAVSIEQYREVTL
jgi:hypothetical protein